MLAVYGQDVDTGVWRANCKLFEKPEAIVRTTIVENGGGAVCEYVSLKNLERIAAETMVQMKFDHKSDDDD